jgi:hypothetical protein
MDPGFRSPFVDLFLRGGAAPDIRLLAARGLLPRPVPEQIALLVVLSDDQDSEIAAQANATIARLPREALADFLASDVPAELRAFFAARGALPQGEVAPPDQAVPREAVPDQSAEDETAPDQVAPDEATPDHVAPDEATPDHVAPDEAAPDHVAPDDATPDHVAPEEATEDSRLMSSLAIADRLKLATKGTREQRGQLIRDANRIVATAVLTSPKLSESEVEAFAKMGNVSEDVLRIIGTNRAWLKNYGIVHALTRNPKTPPAISMHLMHRLTEKDIKMLTTDRNVPEALRLAARRILTKATDK